MLDELKCATFAVKGRRSKTKIRRRARPVADIGDQVRMGLQVLGLAAQPLGMRPVVGVLAGDEVAARLGQRRVARRIGAAVLGQPDQPDALVLLGQPGDEVGGAVGAGVVGDQDLEVPPGLARDRAQAGADRVRAVVGGHDHRDLHGAPDLFQFSGPAKIVDAGGPGAARPDQFDPRRGLIATADRGDPVDPAVLGRRRNAAGAQQQEVGLERRRGRRRGDHPVGLLDPAKLLEQRQLQYGGLDRAARAVAPVRHRAQRLERRGAPGRVAFGVEQDQAALRMQPVRAVDRLARGDGGEFVPARLGTRPWPSRRRARCGRGSAACRRTCAPRPERPFHRRSAGSRRTGA